MLLLTKFLTLKFTRKSQVKILHRGSLKLIHAPILAIFCWGTLYNLGQALNEPSWSPAASVRPGRQQVFSVPDRIRRAGFQNCHQTPRQFSWGWSIHSHRHCEHSDGYSGGSDNFKAVSQPGCRWSVPSTGLSSGRFSSEVGGHSFHAWFGLTTASAWRSPPLSYSSF